MEFDNPRTGNAESQLLSDDPSSYSFVATEINKVVTRTSPGVYVLGHLSAEGRFAVTSIGRADEDLKDELTVRLMLLLAADLVAAPEDDFKSRYAQFKFCYTDTAEEAFEKECLAFHEVLDMGGQLEDGTHPTNERGHATNRGNGNGREPRSFCPIWQCAWNY